MDTSDDDTRTRLDREAILARRRRFVAAAITGLTTSTLATACPCLKVDQPGEGSTSEETTGTTTTGSTSTDTGASTSVDTGASTSTDTGELGP